MRQSACLVLALAAAAAAGSVNFDAGDSIARSADPEAKIENAVSSDRAPKNINFGADEDDVDQRVSYQPLPQTSNFPAGQAFESGYENFPPYPYESQQPPPSHETSAPKHNHQKKKHGNYNGGGYYPTDPEYYGDYDYDDTPPALEKIGNFFKGIDMRSDILKPTVSGLVLSGVFLGTTFFFLPLIGGKLSIEAKDISVEGRSRGDGKGSLRDGKGLLDLFDDRTSGFLKIFKAIDPLTPLRWVHLERESCQRRMVCEVQNRIAKFPMMAKLSRSFFSWLGRYTDAVDAGDRHDVCYRSFNCQYGLKGLWSRIQRIFGARRLDGSG